MVTNCRKSVYPTARLKASINISASLLAIITSKSPSAFLVSVRAMHESSARTMAHASSSEPGSIKLIAAITVIGDATVTRVVIKPIPKFGPARGVPLDAYGSASRLGLK